VKFLGTPLAGAFVIETEPMEDARGSFARLWCRDEFAAHGIAMEVAQSSVSHNIAAGTLRGMHFQWPPSREAKFVRCERGRVHDVIVDLRPEAPTFTRHFALELDGDAHNALYVPPGFAHGFQTLVANSDVVYLMADVHRPDLEGSVRYNDPTFGIVWPLAVTSISGRDRDTPDFDRAAYVEKYLQATETPYSGTVRP